MRVDSRSAPTLPGRFHPQFCDQNRRDIGKSQSKWTASEMETPGSQRGDGRPDRPHHGLVVLVPAACSITGMRATLEQRERGGGASGHQNPQLAVPWVGRSIGLLRRASSRLLDDASQGREAEGGGGGRRTTVGGLATQDGAG
jgi:hypothetical protein